MNGSGHKKIVELVNSGLDGIFPETELLIGSVDPDQSKVQSYTGNESKHHFHPDTMSNSAGRIHGQWEIQEIVYRRAHNARLHWLANDKDCSAFEFGVATHYFMDGLICSPSLDEAMHTKGDRTFTNAAFKASVPVRKLEGQATKNRVNKLISHLASHFGASDPVIVDMALQVLIELGWMVTDSGVPKPFCKRIDGIIEDFQITASQIEDFYKNQSLVNSALLAIFKVRFRNIRKSPKIIRAIIISDLYKYSFSSLKVKFLHKSFNYEIEGAFQKKMPGELHLSQTYKKATSSVNSQEYDSQWYSSNKTIEFRSYSLAKLGKINDRYMGPVNEIKKRITEKCADLMIKQDKLITTEIHKHVRKEMWFNSRMRWLGEKSANDPFVKYACTIPVAMAFWAFYFIAKTLGIVPIPTSVITIFTVIVFVLTWRYIKTCEGLWNFCYKTIEATCPKCQAESYLHFDRHTRIATCPECDHKIQVPQSVIDEQC